MLLSPRLRRLLRSIAREQRRPLLLLLTFALIQTVVATAGDPLLMKWLIDSISSGDVRLFVGIGCAAVAFYTVTRVLDYIYVILKTRVRLAVTADFCEKATSLYFRQPYAEVRRHDNGYYNGRLYDESQEIAGLLDTSIDIFRAVVGFLSALAVCLWLSWKLALAISAVVPLLLYVAGRYGRRISQSSIEVQETEASLRDTLGQVVGSYKLSNMLPAVSLPMRALRNSLQGNVSARMRIARLSSLFQMASGISLSYAEMAVMLSAGFEVISGRLSVGGLFSFMSAYWRAVRSVQGLIDLTPQLARLDGVAQRLEEFAARAQSPAERDGDTPRTSIRLRGVGLAHGDKAVLSDLNLELRQGQRLLIVGANGSGKSSLIDLLCGFLPAQQGQAELPARLSISCQFTDSPFFPGSVRDNLEAVVPTGADGWLHRLDLYAAADQQPYLLSAGQQRKLQIGMTLAKDADFYFFDEPLANLDEISRPRLFELILNCSAGRTLIMVMHGEEGRRHCFDQVLDLDTGMLQARTRPVTEVA